MNPARLFHRGRQNAARPSIELLEVRLLPALILWDGGPAATGTNWNDPVNWAGDALPGANDDAQIGGTFAGMTVTASGQVAVRSLSTAASLKVTAGTFALGAATSRIDAALAIDGGTLQLGGTILNGAGTLTSTATVQLSNSKVNAPLVNQGTLLVHGTTALNGALSNLPGGTLRVDGIGSTSGASLTVANGFTNQGTIELTADSGWSGDMTVSSGTLTNAAGATIRVLAGGSRSLSAQLDNRGLLDVRSNLFSLGKPSAAQTNSGAISVTGGLVVSQSGTSPSFTNTGIITIGGGSFSLSGGAFNHTAGTVRGAGTWSLTNVTAGFGGDFDNGVASVLLSNSTVNSPGTFRNAAGNTVTLTAGSVVNAALLNQGTLVVQGNAALDGAFGNLPGATLRVVGSGLTSGAHLTVASGFINQGTIEMTGDQNWFSQLTVSSGTLTNAVGGSIHLRPSGDRILEAQLDNQGLFDAQLDVQNRLTVSKASAAHTNSGTIRFSGGNFTIGQPGTAQSFTNTGVLDVGGNGMLTVATGITNDGSGILTGQPSGTLAIGGNLAGATNNADLFAPQAAIRFTGPGTAGHPQLLEVLGEDLGNVGAGLTNNFALATLSLDSTYVRLVDNADNAPGTEPEALYVNRLIVPAGATLDLNSFHVYARQMQIDGTVLGGTVAQAPDGGPIALNSTTAGTIGATGEVDEWTFFGRAGQAVTILANPGATGAPAPLPPMLNIANVRLVGPSGALIASGSSASSGQIATLQAVPLPADGTYRIQVRAAAGGDRGDYTLALWNATVNTRPLVVNQQTNGVLETPFSVDRWTFTAAANQQVSFDWINAAPATLQFKLTGPNNFTGFSGLTGDSGLVTLPANGTYTVEVTAGANQGGSYAFRLVESSQTVLTLGMPYVGTMIANGQYQLFRVDLPAGQQLRVVLDDAHDNNRNELYAQFGSPPTRAHFDFSATTASADQQLFVPAAAPGTWYVLIYSPSVPSPGSFTLTADAGALFLSSTTPDHLGNGTDMTLTLTGAGFDRTTIVELMDSGGATYPADALSIDTPTHLTATFAAGSLPPGTYSVRARRPAGGEADLANAFRVVAGGHSNFEANLEVPAFAYYGPTLQYFYVEYANTGDAPMLAPLLVVHSTNNAKLRIDDHRLVQGAQTSAAPAGYSDTVQINGSGATPGLLQPGEHVTVRVDYVGLQQPYDFGDNFMRTTLSVFTSDNTPIDWPSLQDTLRPPGISAEAWVPIFANLVAQVGPTWGDFQSMLSDNAQYLARLGETVTDVDSLWQFEVEQAIGFSPVPDLDIVTDIQVDAPGLPITFSRVFSNSTIGRYDQGPVGRGWALADGWDRTLTLEEDGTAVISGIDGHQRRFEPDGRTAGVYFSQDGDHATLSGLADGTFVLRETDGLVTRFRSDGRVDYIEDPNGNRITATWTGALLTRLMHSAGQFLQINYNNAGRIAGLTDQAGRTVVYTYDASGEHLLSVRGIDGQTTQYTYGTGALVHALESIQYPDNTHQYFTYDAHGRLDSMARDNDAERASFTYDSAGGVTATDALGDATKYFFDERGQLGAIEDPLGRRTLFDHDADLNETSLTDAMGQTYLYQYDASGNVVRSTNPLGQVTTFSYTSDFNRLASTTDARGNTLAYGYDGRGNLTSITYPDGSVQRFAVDARGEIDGWTDRRGQTVDYLFDTDGRLERRDLPDGSFVEYHYDARGNVVQAIDATGITQLEYLDSHNPDLPTKITYPDGRFLRYTYQNERRTSMVDQDGLKTNYFYDAAGRLEFLRDGAGNLIDQYHYDLAGRLVREDKGNGTFTEYQYDADGELEHLINRAPNGTVDTRFDYVYDALGRQTRMTTLDGVWDYSYDGIGELTRAVFTSNDPAVVPDQDLQYVYDAVGNRIRTVENGVTTDYVTNDLNEYTQIGTATLAYDLDGNLVSRTDEGGTTTFSYDALNRLTAMTGPGGTSSYQFDAFDNRTATIQNGQQTSYLIDPYGLGDVVGEYDAGGSLLARYIYGLGLTSRVSDSGSASFYDFDASGNTAQVTGTAGAVLNTYRYLPFGESLTVKQAVANPFTDVGQFGVMDGGQGLSFMRERWYDPAQGRFTSPDPIGLSGGDVNLYRYTANGPVNYIDPTGLDTIDLCTKFANGNIVRDAGTDDPVCMVKSTKEDCDSKGGTFLKNIGTCSVPVEIPPPLLDLTMSPNI